jgi:hypothetical protein
VLCSLVEVYRHFRGGYYPSHETDDGSSNHPWNVCKFLPNCMVQHPRRQPSQDQNCIHEEMKSMKITVLWDIVLCSQALNVKADGTYSYHWALKG